MLFDTHAHYDDERFDADRDEVLSSLPFSGVGYVLNAGSDLESSRMSISMAEKYPFVYAAVGVHPHSAKELDDAVAAELARLAVHPKVRAVGEIGLDYHYDFSPRDIQQKALARQLDLAASLRLPVIIHNRKATEDILSILAKSPVRGVFHCFSGSVETAKILLARGWYLSFTGMITFPNSKTARAVVASMPLDRLMLETDCPYMAPEPFRGKRCDSTLLYLVAEEVARIHDKEPGEIIRITTENAKRFFKIEE